MRNPATAEDQNIKIKSLITNNIKKKGKRINEGNNKQIAKMEKYIRRYY